MRTLGGPSPWQAYLQANLKAHSQGLPAKPIRIVTDGEFARRYKEVFRAEAPADAQGFVDRRNALIYLQEFPAGSRGVSVVGIALHEAVHLFSHPPGRSKQLRATAFNFMGVALLEGFTQVVTEDIQAAQGIKPMRERWRAYRAYTPLACRFIDIFTPAVIGDAFFNGNLNGLLRAVESRWTVAEYHKVMRLAGEKKTEDALKSIDDLERLWRKRPRIQEFQWTFR